MEKRERVAVWEEKGGQELLRYNMHISLPKEETSTTNTNNIWLVVM